MERLVAVSIKSAGERIEGRKQRAPFSIFEEEALARSHFRRAVETKNYTEFRIEQHVAVPMSVADYGWLSGIEQSR